MTAAEAKPTAPRRARWLEALSRMHSWTASAELQGWLSSDGAERLRLALEVALLDSTELSDELEFEAALSALKSVAAELGRPRYDPAFP